MKTPAQPAPPDPKDTAQAQAQANSSAAQTQQQLNMVNQVNPYGNLTYSQTGTTKGPNGTKLPQYTATTVLSPQEQAKQEQQWKFDGLVNNLGIQQTEKLTGLLDKPVNLNNEASESRLMELGSKRLDPLFDQRRSATESRLANQGIYKGSEAYDREFSNFGQQENDAYNQLLLTGRGQAVQEALTERNQPINEITALMSGGQVSQPNFTNTPTASVGAPDVAGLTMDAYKYGPLAQYQAQQSQQNAMMGGLFGLGGAVGGGWARNGFKFG
jgi:hypothetical protein